MASNLITLTAGMTQNLLSLQNTSKLMEMTQGRIATGKKVNSALDDPIAFFDADSHYTKANDFAAFKNAMLEGVQTIKQGTNTIDSLKAILEQMKSIANSAKVATTAADINNYELQYISLRAQFNNLQGDASYKGVNLLASSDKLEVVFNTNNVKLTVTGFDGTATGVGASVVAANDWVSSTSTVNATAVTATITAIDSAIATLRTKAKVLATNLGIVNERISFTDKLVATFKTGGDNLTLADMNEEGANMLMLQTRQAMGIQSLSIASQAAQQVLQLFQ